MKPDYALDPQCSTDQALFGILLAELSHLKRWRKVAIKGRDPEGIHQLRVGLRRMRSALDLFQALLSKRDRKALTVTLKRVTRKLDTARDLDVLLQDCFHANAPASPLLQHFSSARADAYRRVANMLRSQRFRRMLRHLRKRLLRAGLIEAERDRPLTDFANAILQSRLEKVIMRCNDLDIDNDEALHRLRISCKKLRYGCEFFHALYPPARMVPFLASVKSLLKTLGDIHDCYIQQQLLRPLTTSRPTAHQLMAQRRVLARQRKQALTGDMARLLSCIPPWS